MSNEENSIIVTTDPRESRSSPWTSRKFTNKKTTVKKIELHPDC
jgi:hypothetical protein